MLTRTLHSGALRAGESRICGGAQGEWLTTRGSLTRQRANDHHPSSEGEPARACHPSVSPTFARRASEDKTRYEMACGPPSRCALRRTPSFAVRGLAPDGLPSEARPKGERRMASQARHPQAKGRSCIPVAAKPRRRTASHVVGSLVLRSASARSRRAFRDGKSGGLTLRRRMVVHLSRTRERATGGKPLPVSSLHNTGFTGAKRAGMQSARHG